MNPIAARAWCQALALQLPKQEIRPQGTPYLTRYFAAGWSPYRNVPGPALYLHHFTASDPNDSVHSHPWDWGCSLILVGGYIEHRCSADGNLHSVDRFEPGAVNVLEPTDRHRIDLIERDCWTLFLAGRYQQPWGFFPVCA